MPESRNRFAVNLAWLVKLRWVAVIGQLLTIAAAVLVLEIRLLLWPLLLIIGLTALSNLVLAAWFFRVHRPVRPAEGPETETSAATHIPGLVMTMDMLSLTTLLYVTGGPTNPFWLFFFVNLSLSAVLLDRNWAWGLNLLSIACFTMLMVRYIPVSRLDQGAALDPIFYRGRLSLPQAGLIAAFVTCSSVIVWFMTRLTRELQEHEVDLRLAQQRQSRNEKIEALGTLAAGAAHELATPLTTIALVARDVEETIRNGESHLSGDHGLLEDVGLIRQQLDRCKKILDRMASHAGETVGEMMQQVVVRELVDEVREGLVLNEQRVDVQYSNYSGDSGVHVPLDALSQAIRGLVQNALDASRPGDCVSLRIDRPCDALVWTIIDKGAGMSAEVLRRVSEPFFTTKQPGKGMGLGVFLARNVVERLGGTVEFQSRAATGDSESGTIVTVTLPQPESISGEANA